MGWTGFEAERNAMNMLEKQDKVFTAMTMIDDWSWTHGICNKQSWYCIYKYLSQDFPSYTTVNSHFLLELVFQQDSCIDHPLNETAPDNR